MALPLNVPTVGVLIHIDFTFGLAFSQHKTSLSLSNCLLGLSRHKGLLRISRGMNGFSFVLNPKLLIKRRWHGRVKVLGDSFFFTPTKKGRVKEAEWQSERPLFSQTFPFASVHLSTKSKGTHRSHLASCISELGAPLRPPRESPRAWAIVQKKRASKEGGVDQRVLAVYSDAIAPKSHCVVKQFWKNGSLLFYCGEATTNEKDNAKISAASQAPETSLCL